MRAPRLARRLALCAALGGCAPPPPPLPAPEQIPAPDPAEVEHVVFLVGDAGAARAPYYPILPRLQQDIEWWADRLPADSAVTVLFLGDIVYPLGLHPPGSPEFPHDSAVVMDQVGLLAGPRSRERGARGYFVAGNHDWGLEPEWEGFVRLKRLDEFLDLARAWTGASVWLAPEAGRGGPHVLDLGRHLRVLLLDTAWWLLDAGREDATAAHAAVLAGVEEAIRTAGGREVMLAAHHPFRTAGPHGGEVSFWRTLGIQYLLYRSGAILQDLTSIPYRELEQGLRAIFARTRPPLASIGGHEHSLQVMEAVQPTDPAYTLVSGSASKLTGVGWQPGVRFARSAPGYIRLLVHRDGRISVWVEAAPERYQKCPRSGAARERCMAEGIAAFRTVHSQLLRRSP